MGSEYNVLIWSTAQNKWVNTYLYFPTEPPGDNPSPAPGSTTTIIEESGAQVESVNFEPTSGYQELFPANSIFPTNETWYTDDGKTKKIIEKDITWNGVNPTIIIYKIYGVDGISITQTIQDTISYYKIFKQRITRIIL